MAYTAIARKWRPSTFEDLVGQDHVGSTVMNAIKGGRVHHAFLFTGTRGVGKTTSARILAKALNCMEGEPGVPCGKCRSCLEVSAGNSLDVLEIDGASNNKVEHIRELIEQVRYAPMSGKYRIIVIDEVHMLTRNAFNALLKTLEEPPEHVIFIFATTEANRVPPTILSRVLRFDFKRIGPIKIAERLRYIADQEQIQVDEQALLLLSEKADGSMRDALTLFDQVFSFSGNEITEDAVRLILGVPPDDMYFRLLDAIANHDPAGCFAIVEEFQQQGIEIREFGNGLARMFRNMLYSRIPNVESTQVGISESVFLTLKEKSQIFQTGDILRYSKLLNEVLASLRNSPQPRITLETGLVRMAYLDRVVDLKKVLQNQAVLGSEPEKKNSIKQ